MAFMNSYDTDDTIAAISSGSGGISKIIRISGLNAFELAGKWIDGFEYSNKILNTKIRIDSQLYLPCRVISFQSPKSYTGDNIVEIHIYCAQCTADTIIANLLSTGARAASAGEFTARAYLNGKLSLEQAEAVAQIIQSSNKEKLIAAQQLFKGRLKEKLEDIISSILEIMSLIEAGLDFSQEDIEFISVDNASKKLEVIISNLSDILHSDIAFEEFIELPCVGITGAANAGKSSLINAVLGFQRSIVSNWQGTTRDILKAKLELEKSNCIIFDCAGFVNKPKDLIDELAIENTASAIQSSQALLFCIDCRKDDYHNDAAILSYIKKISNYPIIAVLTKSDTIDKDELDKKAGLFGAVTSDNFVITSAKTGYGIELLKSKLDDILSEQNISQSQSEKTIINARHRENINTAIGHIHTAKAEIKKNSGEIAAMLLRQAYNNLNEIENEFVDEKILDRIFGNFCIGK